MRQRRQIHLQNFAGLGVVNGSKQRIVSLVETFTDGLDLLVLVDCSIQNVELNTPAPPLVDFHVGGRPLQ
jgi:hypothetical protein